MPLKAYETKTDKPLLMHAVRCLTFEHYYFALFTPKIEIDFVAEYYDSSPGAGLARANRERGDPPAAVHLSHNATHTIIQ